MIEITDEMRKEIGNRYLAGESTTVLARFYGVSAQRVGRALDKLGIPRRAKEDRPIQSNAAVHQMDIDKLTKMVETGVPIHQIAKGLGCADTTIWRTCEYLGISLPRRRDHLVKKHNPVPKSLFSTPIINSEESWLLGLLLTDGCVNDGGRIALSLTDEDGVLQAKKIIGFGDEIIVIKSSIGRQDQYRYRVQSRILANRLEKFGLVPRKSSILQFPDPSVLQLPDFIRGIWDGDGSWSFHSRDKALIASYGCASEEFILSLRDITSKITGSSSNVRKVKGHDYWHLFYQGQSAKSLAQWLYYDESVVCLSRKRSIVLPFL